MERSVSARANAAATAFGNVVAGVEKLHAGVRNPDCVDLPGVIPVKVRRNGSRGCEWGGPDRRLRDAVGLYDHGEVSDLIELQAIIPVYEMNKNTRFGL
jgi:hypothetical protein